MSPLTQLSESEIESRFHVTGDRPVAFMLAGFAKECTPFSVRFRGGEDMFLTTLLAVLPEKMLLIFDCSGSTDTNRHVMLSDRNVFVGRPGGIPVQFSVGPVSELIYGGSKAFSVALPKFLVRLQRREFFRIETPRVKPLQFFCRLPEGSLLSVSAHNISVAGIGLTASHLPEGLSAGLVLPNCHFSLPEEKSEFFCDATMRHQTEQEARAGIRQWRIGIAFNSLSGADENRLQRYIARVERERHELS